MQLQKTERRADILVAGANGALGRTLIELLGPERAVAGTRHENWAVGPFEHVSLANDDATNAIEWQRFRVVINVAGRVRGNMPELLDANVRFPVELALAARAGNVTKFVQVSSFSIYGLANFIDANTPELPTSEYGRTKAEGDRQLASLATSSFQIASLRLPFLFDLQHPALFDQLFRLIKILPVLPVSSEPTRRSMISYADASRTLMAIGQNARSGILHSAAPRLFDFALLTKLLSEEAEFRLRTFPLPSVLVNMARLAVPGIHRRIFQSSVLCADLNIANEIAEIDGLELPIRGLIRNYFS